MAGSAPDISNHWNLATSVGLGVGAVVSAVVASQFGYAEGGRIAGGLSTFFCALGSVGLLKDWTLGLGRSGMTNTYG